MRTLSPLFSDVITAAAPAFFFQLIADIAYRLGAISAETLCNWLLASLLFWALLALVCVADGIAVRRNKGEVRRWRDMQPRLILTVIVSMLVYGVLVAATAAGVLADATYFALSPIMTDACILAGAGIFLSEPFAAQWFTRKE